jgi:hypothetical protein
MMIDVVAQVPNTSTKTLNIVTIGSTAISIGIMASDGK